MLGFKFCDKHSNDYNLVVKSIDRSLLPKKRIVEEIIPNRHGSYKFEDGYNDRTIQVECTLKEKDIGLRRQKLREIASWLSIEGQLIFDDEPDKYYTGRLDDEIGLSVNTRFDRFTLNFKCKPFAYSVYDNENIPYDKDLAIDSELMEGLKTKFENITSNKIVKISNLGTIEAYPIVEIEGTADVVVISNDTGSFSISNITEKTYVDCENMLCYTIDGLGNKVNKLLDFEGDFIKLNSGLNEVSIEGTNLNLSSVFFNFRNTYL